MPPLNLELTLEQQFNLSMFKQQAQHLSREDAIVLLQEVMTQLVIKDNVIKSLIKQDFLGEAIAEAKSG